MSKQEALPDTNVSTGITRRSLLVTGAVAAGYALAVRPIAAETITTDAEGLVAGDVEIPTSDIQMRAYRARPAQGPKPPIVLVVQEIFGVHEHIRDVCRRLAKQGYLAIAPDLYQRQGDVTKMTDIQQIVRDVVAKVPDAQVLSDLDAAVTWAGTEGDMQRLAITGFCWGGRIVWLYAARSSALRAGVAWYGRLAPRGVDVPGARHPLDVAAELKAPVLGLYGGKDDGIPLDTVEKMREALKAAGKPSEIVVYPDAPHGFHADYRPSYREVDAKDGFKRMLDWFKKHGV
jgi:carboxymethylenebutenolidase